jgi:hypothetical protein
MKIRCLSLATVVGVAVAAGAASAQTHPESGDAGSLPGSAQVVSGSGVLANITGSIEGLGDADLFRIVIHDPAAFGATTAIAPGTMSDTTLYLFHLDGTGIAKNDDISGSNYLSSLSAGDPKFTSLAPGEYLLGISGYAYSPYWNDPPTVYGDLVFDVLTYTGVLGPQPGAGPVVGWIDVGAYSTGTYNITLTGASFVPAPGSVALLGLGGLVAVRRRRVA